MEEKMLQIENLCKSFGATKANQNIGLAFKRGSIHGLAGENGSGKSTLASIICGMQNIDSGNMIKDNKEYHPANPIDANNHRVSMVVQELGVVGKLPGSVNMFLGRTGNFKKAGIISLTDMRQEAQKQFEKWGLTHVPLDCLAEELSIEQRKMLELARALSTDPDFLVLDEISQALSHDNREVLYKFIKNFTSQGRTILMITHDLEEMMEICDTISVLRDGELIETKASKDMTQDELKRLMIGREVSGDYYRDDWEEEYEDEIILKADHISVPGSLADISFELHKGEILGVCGLSDGGIHELGRALFGMADKRTGDFMFLPTGRQLETPMDLIEAGGAYLSKDRDSDGLMLEASIGDNIVVPSLRDISGRFAYLSPLKVRRVSEEASKKFEIKSTGIGHIVKRLSGGNKQKVNLSRWLMKDLKFIILDCPTRGVDIGVKAYIYKVLKELKKEGLAILLISDELQEAMGMADRILVMKEHQVAGLLSRNTDFTEEKIVEVML